MNEQVSPGPELILARVDIIDGVLVTSLLRTVVDMAASADVMTAVSVGEFDSDFYFEEADAAGELDGRRKYLDPAYRGGRSAEQVVYDEKLREDAIRRQVAAFLRWPYATGMSRDLLRALLMSAGVQVGLARPRLA